jgi:hypothetical protein
MNWECPCDTCCGRLEPFSDETLDEQLDRLLTYALESETCLKVFVSGTCSHPFNADNRMHVCKCARHWDTVDHKCSCGKEWAENRITLTDSQYAIAAYMKAVE